MKVYKTSEYVPSFPSTRPPPYSQPSTQWTPQTSSTGSDVKSMKHISVDEESPLLLHAVEVASIRRRRSNPLHLLFVPFLFSLILLAVIIRYAFPTFFAPPPPAPTPTTVAIIGGGPAGIAAARRLEKLSVEVDIPVDITIYERKHALGGRLVLSPSNSDRDVYPFEDHSQAALQPEDIAGGSLLHSSAILRKELEISGNMPTFFDHNNRVGVSDGQSFIVDITRPTSRMSWSTWLGQVYRYGASAWRGTSLPVGTVSKIKGLTKLVKHGSFPFSSIAQIRDSLGLAEEASMAANTRLAMNGISEQYTQDIIAPESRRRYGQAVGELSDLALSMAVNDDDQESARAGGLILPALEDMAVYSRAHIRLSTAVSGLKLQLMEPNKTKWIVQSHNESSSAVFEEYDKIIIATPWEPEAIELLYDCEASPETLHYQSRHVTFFTSSRLIDDHRFASDEPGPDQILFGGSVSSKQLSGIDEVAHVKELTRLVDDAVATEHLYRVLSRGTIDDSELVQFFMSNESVISWTYREVVSTLKWYHRPISRYRTDEEPQIESAYPLLYPRDPYGPMALSDSLWHTAAIEGLASSIDFSMFAGENVAALLMDQLKRE
ncbi:MAG: hypothetical protein M1825_004641 [Sarcosagium campestre]|nr:MAG: hypothetical protein M1825_004641 [Sarcosagium campestre]